MRGTLGHVSALDGIRGIAIALVIADHYFGLNEGGSTGVRLFFVLSGFLITTLLLEERAATGAIRLGSFYGRRARRLLPALAVMLFIYLGSQAAGPGLGVAAERVALAGSYVSNFVVAFHWHDVITGTALGPLWSLAQEEQFYALWPLLLIFGLRSRRMLLWLLCAIIALVAYQRVLVITGASSSRVYYGPDTNPLWLLTGAALALARREGRNVPTLLSPIAVGCSAWYIASANLGWPWVGNTLSTPLLLASYATLVAAAHGSGLVARLLSFRPIVWLGAISYSIYLWHIFALSLTRAIWAAGLDSPAWRVISVALVTLVGWGSYRFVEQPFRRTREPAPPVGDPVPLFAQNGP